MNYTIRISGKAEQDIRETVDYILSTLLNPQAAADLLDSIDEEIGKLAFMPGKNRLVEDPVLAAWGIRSTAIRNYLAFYVIDEDSKTVHLVRFLYGRRNWISILRGEQGEE